MKKKIHKKVYFPKQGYKKTKNKIFGWTDKRLNGKNVLVVIE